MKNCTTIVLKPLVAAFTATMLFMTGHGEAKPDAASDAGERTQRQIKAIPFDSGIHYIGDPQAGLCFAGHKTSIGFAGSLTLFVVPCTKGVLSLIPDPKDRPAFTPQEQPLPTPAQK